MNFINKEFTYAIVGASSNEEKYGFKVLKNLKEKGFVVVPINPKGESILGLKTAKDLSSVDSHVDVVVFVVPPSVSALVVHEVLALGITKVWFQPGSESVQALAFCKGHKIAYVVYDCIMVASN